MRIATSLKWIGGLAKSNRTEENKGSNKVCEINGRKYEIHNLRIAKTGNVEIRTMLVQLYEATNTDGNEGVLISKDGKKMLKSTESITKGTKKELEPYFDYERKTRGAHIELNIYVTVGLVNHVVNVKRIGEVLEMAKENGYYINNDKFGKKAPSRLMLISHRDPNITWVPDLEDSMETWIENKIEKEEWTGGNTKVEIIKRMASTNKNNNKKSQAISSVILEMRCKDGERKRIKEIVESHKTEFEELFGQTMMTDEINDRPKKYKQFLMDNNKFLEETEKITVSGIDEKAWFTNSPNLFEIVSSKITMKGNKLFLGIERTGKSAEKGTWFFVVDKTMMEEVQDYIEQQLATDYNG
jgi:hypothetical protein